jgi:hypothetical protein
VTARRTGVVVPLTRLPTSFTQTLNWVFTGATPSTTTAVKTTENSMFNASLAGEAAGQRDHAG